MSYASKFGSELIALTEAKGAPMTEQQSKDLLNLIILGKSGDDRYEDLKELFGKDFIYQILEQRLKVMLPQVEVPLTAKLWLYSLARGNPGNAVMMCTVVALAWAVRKEPVVLSDLILMFPMKVPTEEVFHSLWDTQKGRVEGSPMDNLLDVVESWSEDLTEPEAIES